MLTALNACECLAISFHIGSCTHLEKPAHGECRVKFPYHAFPPLCMDAQTSRKPCSVSGQVTSLAQDYSKLPPFLVATETGTDPQTRSGLHPPPPPAKGVATTSPAVRWATGNQKKWPACVTQQPGTVGESSPLKTPGMAHSQLYMN